MSQRTKTKEEKDNKKMGLRRREELNQIIRRNMPLKVLLCVTSTEIGTTIQQFSTGKDHLATVCIIDQTTIVFLWGCHYGAMIFDKRQEEKHSEETDQRKNIYGGSDESRVSGWTTGAGNAAESTLPLIAPCRSGIPRRTLACV